jgi:hypothetical protein
VNSPASISQSKLSRRQIEAMIERMQATIDSHMRKPETAKNTRDLIRTERRLADYRAQLDAMITAQVDADTEAAQESRESEARDKDIARNGGTLEERKAARERLKDRNHENNRRYIEEQEAKRAARPEKLAAAPRRAGSSRKHYGKPIDPDSPKGKAEAAAQAQASKATARAVFSGDDRPEGGRTDPDAELAIAMRELLAVWTMGTVIDMAWATSAEMFKERSGAKA